MKTGTDPEYIPMPGPGEFTTGAFRKGDKCYLVGWARVASGGDGDSVGDETFYQRLLRSLEDAVSRREYSFVSEFNDDDVGDEDRAAVWREAAAELGYVEIDE